MTDPLALKRAFLDGWQAAIRASQFGPVDTSKG